MDHLTEYELSGSCEVSGYLGRIISGERSASRNGGRSVELRDQYIDQLSLWITVINPFLPSPSEVKPSTVPLSGRWQCGTCSYEGKGCLKSGERAKEPLIFVPGDTDPAISAGDKWGKYAHCRNCWFEFPEKAPSPKVHLTTEIRTKAKKLNSLTEDELLKLLDKVKGVVKRFCKTSGGTTKKGTKFTKTKVYVNSKPLSNAKNDILETYGTLTLPMQRKDLKALKSDIELRANLQIHQLDPSINHADTSAIQSLLLQSSSEATATQIREFQRWFTEQIGKSSSNLMGHAAIFAAMHLASSAERLSETKDAYEELKNVKQGNRNLRDYMAKFREVINELEVVTKRKPDDDLTVHFYVLGMSPSVQTKFNERYSSQYPGEKYSWTNVHKLNETLRELNHTTAAVIVDSAARKGIKFLASHLNTMETEGRRSDVRTNQTTTDKRQNRESDSDFRDRTGKGLGKSIVCCKCGNKTSQEPHPWFRCKAIGGRVAERPQGSGQYKMVDLRVLDTSEGKQIETNGGLDAAYVNKPEGKEDQYYLKDGFHDSPRADRHRKMDLWILGGKKGPAPKLSSNSKAGRPTKATINALQSAKKHSPDGKPNPRGKKKQKTDKTDVSSRISALFAVSMEPEAMSADPEATRTRQRIVAESAKGSEHLDHGGSALEASNRDLEARENSKNRDFEAKSVKKTKFDENFSFSRTNSAVHRHNHVDHVVNQCAKPQHRDSSNSGAVKRCSPTPQLPDSDLKLVEISKFCDFPQTKPNSELALLPHVDDHVAHQFAKIQPHNSSNRDAPMSSSPALQSFDTESKSLEISKFGKFSETAPPFTVNSVPFEGHSSIPLLFAVNTGEPLIYKPNGVPSSTGGESVSDKSPSPLRSAPPLTASDVDANHSATPTLLAVSNGDSLVPTPGPGNTDVVSLREVPPSTAVGPISVENRVNRLFGPSVSTEAAPLDPRADTFMAMRDLVAQMDDKSTEDVDCNTGSVPVVGNDGSSHRSITIKFPLDETKDSGKFLAADETNDTGAGLDYIVLDLAEAIAQKCSGSVIEKQRYAKPQMTLAAENSQMARVGYIKVKGVLINDKKEEIEVVRRYEVLTRCILQLIHGIKAQSEDEGCLGIHNQQSSATMKPETYVIRHPSTNFIPLNRQANHLELSF